MPHCVIVVNVVKNIRQAWKYFEDKNECKELLTLFCIATGRDCLMCLVMAVNVKASITRRLTFFREYKNGTNKNAYIHNVKRVAEEHVCPCRFWLRVMKTNSQGCWRGSVTVMS